MHRQEVFTSDYFSQQDIIESIRVAVLSDQQITSVYASAVFSRQGEFTLQLSSDIGLLLTFTYAGSLWLTAKSNNAFGFLKLKHRPDSYFKYLDKHWNLTTHCYTTPLIRKGLHSLKIQGIKLPQADILELRTGGEIETAVVNNSDSIVLNLGRSVQQTQGYYQKPQNTEYYITSVNGYSVSDLIIQSSDSTIEIEGPFPVSDDIYALYIKSLQGFPICPQWSDSVYV